MGYIKLLREGVAPFRKRSASETPTRADERTKDGLHSCITGIPLRLLRKRSAAETPTRADEAKGLVLLRTLNVLVLLFFHIVTPFIVTLL